MEAENLMIDKWESAKGIAEELGFWITWGGATYDWPTTPSWYKIMSEHGEICTENSVADLQRQLVILKNAIEATGKQQDKIVEANIRPRRWWR
ncbi:MAG TPA: hypothetical protein PK384_12710 [Candidatus Latescibacteria bacterium]|nr:hypothetical protein [Candidatus Latescibacterota bacterium]